MHRFRIDAILDPQSLLRVTGYFAQRSIVPSEMKMHVLPDHMRIEVTVRDPLTGLYNRRFLDSIVGRELARAERPRHQLPAQAMADDRPAACHRIQDQQFGAAQRWQRVVGAHLAAQDGQCRMVVHVLGKVLAGLGVAQIEWQAFAPQPAAQVGRAIAIEVLQNECRFHRPMMPASPDPPEQREWRSFWSWSCS